MNTSTNFYVVNNHTSPISLSQAKAFLRVTNESDDSLITSLLNAAINYAENKLNIVIGKKDFECTLYCTSQSFTIAKPHVVSVNSVKFGSFEIPFSQNGNEVTLENEISNKLLTINFTCENNYFGAAVEIAILRHVFYLYENRSTRQFNSYDIETIYNNLFTNNYKI